MKGINVKSVHWKRYLAFIDGIKKRENKNQTEFFEIHHIIPRCAGGTNIKSNLIPLTYREHYIAHWMLSKVGIGEVKYKLLLAFDLIRVYSKSNNYREFLSSKQVERCKIAGKLARKNLKQKTLKNYKFYSNHKGEFFRMLENDPRIQMMNLVLASPTKGKVWYSDGVNFFMLHEGDPKIKELSLFKRAPSKNKQKVFTEESKQNISENRKERFWYNDGQKNYKLKIDDQKIETLSLSKGRIFKESAKQKMISAGKYKRSESQNKNNSERQKGIKRYNDGSKNYSLFSDDPMIKELNLVEGVLLSETGLEKIRQSIKNRKSIVGKLWFNDGTNNYKLYPEDPKTENLTKGKTKFKSKN